MYKRQVQVLRTFGLVCVLNYFDCFSSLGTILGLFASLFTASNWSILWDGSLLELGLTGLDYGILAVGAAVLLGVSLVQRSGSVRGKVGALPYPARFAVWYGLFLSLIHIYILYLEGERPGVYSPNKGIPSGGCSWEGAEVC